MARTRLPGAFYGSFAAIALVFLLALFTQVRAQVTNRNEILSRADKVWAVAKTKEPKPERGTIFSADGRALAQSETKYDFWVFFDRVPCTTGFFMALAEAAEISEARLSAPFAEGKKRVWLQPVNAEQFARISEVKRKWGADGVSLEAQKSRVYPLGRSAVGVIGWTKDELAQSGIERSYNDELSGLGNTRATSKVKKGADVFTTLDSQLQTVAAMAIQSAVVKHNAESGSAVVLIPKTGEIVAMADWPAIDPALGPQRNESERATSYQEDLQPGSTFKVLTLAKAVDLGLVNPEFHMDCKGVLDLGSGKKVSCDLHNGTRAHGSIGIDRAIGKSCNVAASKWALQIGRDSMIDFLRQIGLLDKPQIGVNGAVAPIFDFNEYDKKRQLATLGFGQSIAVTPVGLAGALNVIANDGLYVSPHLIANVGSDEAAQIVTRRVISPESSKTVLKAMEAVVHQDFGTGTTLAIPGITIAGKTGTAQKLGPTGGNVSSFVGIFPAESPQVLILVMVNNPRAGEFYGSLVAGPVFKEIAYAAIERLKIKKVVAQTSAQQNTIQIETKPE